MYTSLRSRTLVFLIGIVILCAAAFAVKLFRESDRTKDITRQQTIDFQQTVEKIVELRGESLRVFAFDYTFWGEMLEFVQSKDPEWAKENIAASLPTYDADAAWVYGLDFSKIYVAQAEGISGLEEVPLPASVLPRLFEQSPFQHFFVESPSGLLEIRVAPIQPSDDFKRVTPANGYYFVGRLWTPERLQALSEALGSDASILTTPFIPEAASASRNERRIQVPILLRGWDRGLVATLLVNRRSLLLEQFERMAFQEIAFFALFAASLLIMLFGFLTREITRPLLQIVHSLQKNNADPITDLCKSETEFGAIARLMQIFFAQRQSLMDEVAERRRAEEELKKTQLQLIQSEKLRSVGRLAAGVAHEVKNPLAVILQAVDYLRSTEIGRNETGIEVLNTLSEAIERADQVIRGLLDFSRLGKLDLHKQPLNPIIEKSLTLVHHELLRKHINVDKQLAGGLPDLQLDANKIEQVLVNVFMNSIQAMADGGTLSLRSFQERFTQPEDPIRHRYGELFNTHDPVVILEIDDTGPGISAEHMQRVFEPFFSTKPEGSGTGLGLAVSLNILRLHHGIIELSNRPEGGVRVRLIFNCAEWTT